MGELNLENLKEYKDEILKAEIGALLFNLGKTHVGFSFWSPYFPNSDYKWASYKEYVDKYLDPELEGVNKQLKDFINGVQVKLSFESLKLKEIMQGKESSLEVVKKVFIRGCENINSGIDKGSPKEQIKSKLWLSNAFGSFKKKVELHDFDDQRICFYNKLNNFLSRDNYYTNPDWQKIREFIFTEIKNWYSRLLSDSRFPVNDVTLWDQAYMTATMFKAVLAELTILKDSDKKLNDYKNNPNNIRWRILGIQYDKLGLAEKGYKPAQIQWYRETARKIDEEIKKLLEYEYPIGNEVYRDETGIYFLVGEDLGVDLQGNILAELHKDLGEIKNKILEIFKEKSLEEFYPAIFLTKASRGLMNLSYLLEKARENFLKADWSKKETDIYIEKSESERAIGICQVCGQRLVFKSDRRDEDKNICNICYEKKTKGRIDKWLSNRNDETIWMDELKDKNDKVALITMKFELHDWLNGDMLNSLIVRNETFKRSILWVKNFILLLLSNLDVSEYFDVKEIERNIAELNVLLKSPLTPPGEKSKLGKKKRTFETLKRNIEKIKKLIENLRKSKWCEEPLNKPLNKDTLDYQNTIEELADMIKNEYQKIKSEFKVALLENFSFFPKYLAAEAYIGCKINNESFDDFIKQIFFGSIMGTHWEEWIKKSSLNSKIDFDGRKINWSQLNKDDIEFLSTLILQFLLRKNPSPARLRRIWESTQEFFEDIKENICAYAGIPENRRKRFYWENIKVKNSNENIPDGEYQDGDVLFWADKGKVYLISYIKDLKAGKEFNLKESTGNGNVIASVKYKDNTDFEYYTPYISIIDPTPISWQFIIPAEYVPNLIDNVMKKYNESFKFVYGKLPLHIGVVVQDYKKPLYIGIKALRKIRRDVEGIEKLSIEEKPSKVREILKCQKIEESLNNTHKYYSLYWGNHSKGYKFYIKPEDGSIHWILNIDEIGEDEKINIIPNTFDFEFLDTNTRRNDIYYDGDNKWKRKIKIKSSRPYDLDNWGKFKKFKDLFGKENKNRVARSTKLQKLISVIYDNWEAIASAESKINSDVEGVKAFLASSFINILDLKKDIGLADGIKDLFDIDKSKENDKLHAVLKEKMTLDNVQLFLDMFEFWHTALKEV